MAAMVQNLYSLFPGILLSVGGRCVSGKLGRYTFASAGSKWVPYAAGFFRVDRGLRPGALAIFYAILPIRRAGRETGRDAGTFPEGLSPLAVKMETEFLGANFDNRSRRRAQSGCALSEFEQSFNLLKR